MSAEGFQVFFLSIWYFIESFFKTCFDLFVPSFFRSPKDVTGEIALVTGGGAGLGRLMAVELSKRGATVVIWDVNQHGNEETARIIRESNAGDVYAYTVDVSKADQVYAAAERVRQEVGNVTMLVNNAGIAHYKPVLECSDRLIQKMVDVNAISHFWLLKTFLPAMKEANHGHIVTIAGTAAYVPIRHMGAYTASVCAAVGIHDAIQVDLAFEEKSGIKMTLVCPALVATNMILGRINYGTASITSPEEAAETIVEGVLLNKRIVCVPKRIFIYAIMKNMIPVKYLVRMLRFRKIEDPLIIKHGVSYDISDDEESEKIETH
ncbi:epidermal retinol dehydrogenase 2-like [Acanthaster planci]|uniref:Short-chain dehydrogenase/reductase 3 n=1 Tax=Acanthaster planci TaxID=133434 RepID=A0A8B8A169_ACAPL|nr:epidermal retinol dehydrogenase 2-like [Acanthaster planci]